MMGAESYTGIALLRSRRAKRRLDPRHRLADGLPGSLITDQGKALAAKVSDVSPHGLGLLVRHALQQGAVVIWLIGGQAYKLDVKWCEADGSGWRCGLAARSAGVDLVGLALAALEPAPSAWDPTA